MADENGKLVTGRTSWDVIASAPKWLLAASAIGFVAMFVYVAGFSEKRFDLGFLGTFGPKLPTSTGSNSLPVGAVVAFDRDIGCPSGWVLFEPAISRTIIGAVASRSVDAPTKDENGVRLKARKYREDGGAEAHILTIAELPRHDHPASLQSPEGQVMVNAGPHGYSLPRYDEALDAARAGGRGPVGALPVDATPVTVDEVGGLPDDGSTRPHNNMPPFIALYFCKKEAG